MDPRHELAKKWVAKARKELLENEEYAFLSKKEAELRNQIDGLKDQLEVLLLEQKKLGARLVGGRALGAVNFCDWYETPLPNTYPTDEDLKLLGIERP